VTDVFEHRRLDLCVVRLKPGDKRRRKRQREIVLGAQLALVSCVFARLMIPNRLAATVISVVPRKWRRFYRFLHASRRELS